MTAADKSELVHLVERTIQSAVERRGRAVDQPEAVAFFDQQITQLEAISLAIFAYEHERARYD